MLQSNVVSCTEFGFVCLSIFMEENKLFTQEQKKMILDTPLTVECFDIPINDKDNEFFHYVWNITNVLGKEETLRRVRKALTKLS